MAYAFAARNGGGGRQPPPAQRVQDPPLHHVPALSTNAVFIDIKAVKPSADLQDRNDFLLQCLKVDQDDVEDIWPEPESNLLRVAFFTAEQYMLYLGKLEAGVPWPACGNALVYGWAPGDATTAVRLTGVPIALPDAAIREHFAQFGRITRLFRSKDKTFTRAANGIVHLSIAVAPGFTASLRNSGRPGWWCGQEDDGLH